MSQTSPETLVTKGRNVAQAIEHLAVKFCILLYGGLVLHGGCIRSLGYFPFQPVVHKAVVCSALSGKMHI